MFEPPWTGSQKFIALYSRKFCYFVARTNIAKLFMSADSGQRTHLVITWVVLVLETLIIYFWVYFFAIFQGGGLVQIWMQTWDHSWLWLTFELACSRKVPHLLDEMSFGQNDNCLKAIWIICYLVKMQFDYNDVWTNCHGWNSIKTKCHLVEMLFRLLV